MKALQNHLGFLPPYNAHLRWGRQTALYFIGHGDLVKIGIAVDLRKRLSTLRAGNPEGLTLLAYRSMPSPLDRQIERRMHVHYADLAIGREWFRGLDVAGALKVATTHIRHAHRAIALWEADGIWDLREEPPEARAATVAAERANREESTQCDLEFALARLRGMPKDWDARMAQLVGDQTT